MSDAAAAEAPQPATLAPDPRRQGALACALVQGLPHAAWLVALPQVVVVAANGTAARLLGRPLAELVGVPAQQLAASPEDLAFWGA
ncbi:MAG: hypothetical protein KIT17_27765, partial [Rubrivivax sp.]|nr:hypothetical protein [Rubrivivax sp.]